MDAGSGKGVAELAGGKIVGIEEKPRGQIELCGDGIYMYDPTVFDKIRTLVALQPRRA